MDDEAYNAFRANFAYAQLIASLLVPLSVALVGWLLNKNISQLETRLSRSEALRQQRVALFGELRGDLNTIFCSAFAVGNWRQVPPPSVIETKRRIDGSFFSSIGFWSAETITAYTEFMGGCFRVYSGPNIVVKLRARKSKFQEAFGDRWQEEWEAHFLSDEQRTQGLFADGIRVADSYTQDLVLPRFAALMAAFSEDLGTGIDPAVIMRSLKRPAPDNGAESNGDGKVAPTTTSK